MIVVFLRFANWFLRNDIAFRKKIIIFVKIKKDKILGNNPLGFVKTFLFVLSEKWLLFLFILSKKMVFIRLDLVKITNTNARYEKIYPFDDSHAFGCVQYDGAGTGEIHLPGCSEER